MSAVDADTARLLAAMEGVFPCTRPATVGTGLERALAEEFVRRDEGIALTQPYPDIVA